MRVDFGGFDRIVDQSFLDKTHVGAVFEQMGSETDRCKMNTIRFSNAGFVKRVFLIC